MPDDMAGSRGAIGSLGTTAEGLRSPSPSMHQRPVRAPYAVTANGAVTTEMPPVDLLFRWSMGQGDVEVVQNTQLSDDDRPSG